MAVSNQPSELRTAAADAVGSRSSGRRLMQFGLGLPDLEALLSDDPSSLESFAAVMQPAASTTNLEKFAAVMQPASTAAVPERSSDTSTDPDNPLSANCFSLPVETCIEIRRANQASVAFAYPYVLGYLAATLASLMQTLLSATQAGAMVIDAKLALTLAQQVSTIVALLGGMGTVVNVDRLFRLMLPM